MPKAPLKKKIAAVFSVFIKYSCCPLEEQKDPLPKEKIYSASLYGGYIYFFVCLFKSNVFL